MYKYSKGRKTKHRLTADPDDTAVAEAVSALMELTESGSSGPPMVMPDLPSK